MYLLLLLHVAVANVLGQQCQTPTGQTGECVPIRSCSSLWWSLTNPKYTTTESLKKFRCSKEEDDALKVCCPRPKKFLVFENEDDEEEEDLITKGVVRNTKNCGIVKGLEVDNGMVGSPNFPWLFKIMAVNFSSDTVDKGYVQCTGALINRRYVVYSAQCDHEPLLNPDLTYFVRREINGCDTPWQCRSFEDYGFDAYSPHPFYDHDTKFSDIAILRLNRPVVFSDNMQPICLPVTNDYQKFGRELYTTGWNRTSRMSDVSTQRVYRSEMISNDRCVGKYPITRYEICSSRDLKVGKDDTIGFPVMSLHDNRWYLLGIDTQGESTRIHTRVGNYLQWIQEMMGGEQCLTPYNETGECLEVTDCQQLNDAFANVSPDDEHILQQFVCTFENDDVTDDHSYLLKVCCGNAPNFTMPPQTVEQSLEISNFKFCGLQHRDDYISSNEEISVDEFPWLAIVLNATSEEQMDAICGGTLITDRYVLTSASCGAVFRSNHTMMVRLGDYNLKNESDCIRLNQFDLYDCSDTQEYGVEKKIIHPFYNAYPFINDIALLRLDKTVYFTDYIRPICLPRSEDDLGSEGDRLYTTGFGSKDTESGEKTTIKKKIPTTLISIEDCKEKLGELGFVTKISAYTFCTEDFKNSTDKTCSGDEGGPVMLSKKNRWFVQGIASTYGCDAAHPQTHLMVFKYLRWIKLNIMKI